MPILDLIVILFLDFCNVYLPICAIQIILFKKILIETVDIVTFTEEFLNGNLIFVHWSLRRRYVSTKMYRNKKDIFQALSSVSHSIVLWMATLFW